MSELKQQAPAEKPVVVIEKTVAGDRNVVLWILLFSALLTVSLGIYCYVYYYVPSDPNAVATATITESKSTWSLPQTFSGWWRGDKTLVTVQTDTSPAVVEDLTPSLTSFFPVDFSPHATNTATKAQGVVTLDSGDLELGFEFCTDKVAKISAFKIFQTVCSDPTESSTEVRLWRLSSPGSGEAPVLLATETLVIEPFDDESGEVAGNWLSVALEKPVQVYPGPKDNPFHYVVAYSHNWGGPFLYEDRINYPYHRAGPLRMLTGRYGVDLDSFPVDKVPRNFYVDLEVEYERVLQKA